MADLNVFLPALLDTEIKDRSYIIPGRHTFSTNMEPSVNTIGDDVTVNTSIVEILPAVDRSRTPVDVFNHTLYILFGDNKRPTYENNDLDAAYFRHMVTHLLMVDTLRVNDIIIPDLIKLSTATHIHTIHADYGILQFILSKWVYMETFKDIIDETTRIYKNPISVDDKPYLFMFTFIDSLKNDHRALYDELLFLLTKNTSNFDKEGALYRQWKDFTINFRILYNKFKGYSGLVINWWIYIYITEGHYKGLLDDKGKSEKKYTKSDILNSEVKDAMPKNDSPISYKELLSIMVQLIGGDFYETSHYIGPTRYIDSRIAMTLVDAALMHVDSELCEFYKTVVPTETGSTQKVYLKSPYSANSSCATPYTIRDMSLLNDHQQYIYLLRKTESNAQYTDLCPFYNNQIIYQLENSLIPSFGEYRCLVVDGTVHFVARYGRALYNSNMYYLSGQYGRCVFNYSMYKRYGISGFPMITEYKNPHDIEELIQGLPGDRDHRPFNFESDFLNPLVAFCGIVIQKCNESGIGSEFFRIDCVVKRSQQKDEPLEFSLQEIELYPGYPDYVDDMNGTNGVFSHNIRFKSIPYMIKLENACSIDTIAAPPPAIQRGLDKVTTVREFVSINKQLQRYYEVRVDTNTTNPTLKVKCEKLIRKHILVTILLNQAYTRLCDWLAMVTQGIMDVIGAVVAVQGTGVDLVTLNEQLTSTIHLVIWYIMYKQKWEEELQARTEHTELAIANLKENPSSVTHKLYDLEIQLEGFHYNQDVANLIKPFPILQALIDTHYASINLHIDHIDDMFHYSMNNNMSPSITFTDNYNRLMDIAIMPKEVRGGVNNKKTRRKKTRRKQTRRKKTRRKQNRRKRK
jgi:hypothetical protein